MKVLSPATFLIKQANLAISTSSAIFMIYPTSIVGISGFFILVLHFSFIMKFISSLVKNKKGERRKNILTKQTETYVRYNPSEAISDAVKD